MNVYVAFLDVLGFKDLVDNNTHEALLRKYQALLTGTEVSLSNGAYKLLKVEGRQVAVADYEKVTVNSIIVSDSIVLWTNNASRKSFIDIVVVARNLLVHAIYTGLPLRGGIAIGPLSRLSYKLGSQFDNTVQAIVGKGLVDAYQIEGEQQWSGCVISQEAIDEYTRNFAIDSQTFNDLPDMAYLMNVGLIAPYNVPVKNGEVVRKIVINWPRGNQTRPTEDMVRKSFGMHNKLATSAAVELKIKNTIDFLNSVLKES